MIFVGYVEEIFQTYLKTSKDDLDDAASKLKRMTPAPMNTMLEKKPRGEAIKKGKSERVWLLLMFLPQLLVLVTYSFFLLTTM